MTLTLPDKHILAELLSLPTFQPFKDMESTPRKYTFHRIWHIWSQIWNKYMVKAQSKIVYKSGDTLHPILTHSSQHWSPGPA